MSNHTNVSADVSLPAEAAGNYGLHTGVLGPVETLAQSVSAVAPSTSPSLTIPLVMALAGNGTWFVYLAATCTILLVGFCVSRFARLSASPGSLYTYTAETLPPIFGYTAAWGLLLAYLATGASVAGGALYYTNLIGSEFFHRTPPALLTLLVVCAVAGWVAYLDVKLSAELMLWIEAISIGLILIVLAAMVVRFGLQIDMNQLRLRDVHAATLGPAVVLAIFSFVGFESATTLGHEVKNPLRTIPRAVLQCAILAGLFFMLCSYSEVLGFRGEAASAMESASPLHQLATKAGISALGMAIDFGCGFSMLACVLACTTAASRVLMRMAREGLLPKALEKTNPKHGTPTAAVALSAALMLAATCVLALRGTAGEQMYDWLGSLAVFGFLTAYALVALALPFARRAAGQHSHAVAVVCVVTIAALAMIVVFDVQSTADAQHARIPWIYMGYVALGIAWSAFKLRRKTAAA